VNVAEGVTFIATANIGNEYTSTRVMDRAILDRFVTIEMDVLDDVKELGLLKFMFPEVNEYDLKAIAEIVINDKGNEDYKINSLISKFELENLKNVKAKFLSGGQKKKLVIALSLLSDPKVLLLDECFAALDVLTIKMLQEIIVNLQKESNITICICDHQARDLLACVDKAMILSNCKIVAEGSPQELVNNIDAKSAYFGDSFNYK